MSATPAPSVPASTPRGVTPSTTPSTSSAPVPPDGTTYAFLTGVDATGYAFSYDKVDYVGESRWARVPVPTTTGDVTRTCYSNTNPLQRTLTVSARTRVLLYDPGSGTHVADLAALRALVRDPGHVPLSTRPFRITVAGGQVTVVESLEYETA